jgi:4'-phosphopantetheinyl transferase
VTAPTGVDVWWFDVGRWRPKPSQDDADLSADERDRAAAFVFDVDRNRYVVAHLALRRTLAGYVGGSAGALVFGRDSCPVCGRSGGRPVLAGEPSVQFSLSHSGALVVVAVANVPVGVDVERLPNRCVCDLARTMHPDDEASLAGLDEGRRHERLHAWWVRTEAVLKCHGSGIAHRIGEFPVLGADAAAGCRLLALPAPEGYAAALAVSGDRAEPSFDVRVRKQP